MWRRGQVPQVFKDATIVHLYKRKGNRQLCDNQKDILLLNIAGKICARILLNRLNGYLEQGLLPESQCGFHQHRGTTDMLFATRQLQEKCQEMRTHLNTTFVDLTKAFDTGNHDGLCKVMHLMFSAMLMDAYRDEQPGIRIAYRTDGHLLNSRRMQAPTQVSTTAVHGLLFADDCAHNTVTEEDTQKSIDLFAAGCADFGLTISSAKTIPDDDIGQLRLFLQKSENEEREPNFIKPKVTLQRTPWGVVIIPPNGGKLPKGMMQRVKRILADY
ncbi:unnamed protein product [Schistocephalus solidus]|uniref:Reverse transcriptase domain-containing protein n=1 Tax=Schistocephalus solidus TaxID=70667 RepID=A0A183SDZ0_SCHSO|nr:unnamed protein product [Schistocephalus solidus]